MSDIFGNWEKEEESSITGLKVLKEMWNTSNLLRTENGGFWFSARKMDKVEWWLARWWWWRLEIFYKTISYVIECQNGLSLVLWGCPKRPAFSDVVLLTIKLDAKFIWQKRRVRFSKIFF
jgi:hypothetical protein